MTAASYLEDAFIVWLRTQPGMPDWITEYRFQAKRRWRFDFAWPEQRVAVEIEGGLFQGGRHQTLSGFLADAEKYESALLDGWTVYRVPGPWIAEGERFIWRQKVMDTLKHLLGVAY